MFEVNFSYIFSQRVVNVRYLHLNIRIPILKNVTSSRNREISADF